jgi:hypothetical protein
VQLFLLSHIVSVLRGTAASQQPRSSDLRLRFAAMSDPIRD